MANKDSIKTIAENKQQNMLLSADEAGEIKFWEMNSGKLACIGGVAPSTVPIELT